MTGERSSDREDAIHQLCRVNREASCFTVTTIVRAFDELRILTERCTLENSFCHFFLAHERAIYEDPIGAGMYGRPSSFRGSLDRESCNHHIFQHSFLREWFHFPSSRHIMASSCAAYSSVTVVCYTFELNIVLGQSSDGYAEMTKKVGTVHMFFKVVSR